MHWNVGDQPSNAAAVDTDLDPWLLLVTNCSKAFDEYFLMVGMVRKWRNDVEEVKEGVCLERDAKKESAAVHQLSTPGVGRSN